MTVTRTPELLADLRKRVALWRQTSVTVGHVAPDEVLALLDRIEALEVFLRRIHGQTDPAVMNQAIWRFLNPSPPTSALSEPDPDEE